MSEDKNVNSTAAGIVSGSTAVSAAKEVDARIMADNGYILVNSEGISDTASELKTRNNNISSAFETLKKSSHRLESSWKSRAGNEACSKMQQMFQIGESRELVLNNYAVLLEQQVNPGYINAENVNTSLADYFK